MGVAALKEALPAYAKDMRLNLDSTIAVSTLPEQRLWGTVLAAAIASRGRRVLAELSAEARGHLSRGGLRGSQGGGWRDGDEQHLLPRKHLLADEGAKDYEDIPPGCGCR